MSILSSWSFGLENYRECSLKEIHGLKYFTTILSDKEYETGRSLEMIFNDHISNRQTRYVEVLYSGGMDSELVLRTLLSIKIPIIVVTLVLKYKQIIINTHDIYYSEKFCRENNLIQKIVELDIQKFFEDGLYLNYLSPYSIIQPHVATHFWLIEQCHYFPIFGGDWQFVQMHRKSNVLSPARLDYSCYELFMKSKGINGIGNMLGNSLESLCYFIALQMRHYNNQNIVFLKRDMYAEIYSDFEIRTRSYGWERFPNEIFDISTYKDYLTNHLGITKPIIYWGDKIRDLLLTTEKSNSLF